MHLQRNDKKTSFVNIEPLFYSLGVFTHERQLCVALDRKAIFCGSKHHGPTNRCRPMQRASLRDKFQCAYNYKKNSSFLELGTILTAACIVSADFHFRSAPSGRMSCLTTLCIACSDVHSKTTSGIHTQMTTVNCLVLRFQQYFATNVINSSDLLVPSTSKNTNTCSQGMTTC